MYYSLVFLHCVKPQGPIRYQNLKKIPCGKTLVKEQQEYNQTTEKMRLGRISGGPILAKSKVDKAAHDLLSVSVDISKHGDVPTSLQCHNFPRVFIENINFLLSRKDLLNAMTSLHLLF